MIFSLLTIILYFFYFLGWALLCKQFTKLKLLVFSELFLAGFITASLFSGVLAFFLPMSTNVEFLGIAISGLGLFFGRKYLVYYFSFKKYYYLKKSFLFCLALLLFASSFSPFILDHYGYYIPTITVLDTNGLVKGIANLQMVLGQNSIWHILQAFTNNTFDVYSSLNVFLLFVFILFVYENKRFILLLFLPLFFLFVQSPSPDLPVFIISVIVVYKAIWEKEDTNFGFLLALSVFGCVIKPTVFWLPLFVFIIAILKNKLKFNVFIIPIVLVLMFVGKNIISSGNILFPIEQFYLNVNWKPNEALIKQSAEIAVQKTYDFQYSLEEVNAFSFIERVTKWLTLSGLKSIIHLLMVITSLGFIIFSFIKKSRIYLVLSVLIILKLFVVFWFSGQYRFMLDGVLVFIMVLLLHLKIKEKLAIGFAVAVSGFLLIGLAFPQILQKAVPSFNVGTMMQGLQLSQLYKPVKYNISDYSRHKIGNLKFNTPNSYPYLLDVPFPAISKYDLKAYYDLGIFPQWQDKTIVMKPLTKSTEENVYSILKALDNK